MEQLKAYWREGWDAYTEGTCSSPYPTISAATAEWWAGWRAAKLTFEGE